MQAGFYEGGTQQWPHRGQTAVIRQAPRDTFLSAELKTDLKFIPSGEAGEIHFTEEKTDKHRF